MLVLGLAVGAYAALVGTVYLAQRRLIYPIPGTVIQPEAEDASLEQVPVPGTRGTVGLYFAAAPDAPTLLHFHGNGEQIADLIALGRALREAPMRWVVAGAAGGGLLLGAVGWLVASERGAAMGTSADASGLALPSMVVSAAEHPPSSLPGAASESEVRPLVESAALAAPRADDALEDWLPAEPPFDLPSAELQPAEASLLSRKSRARREPSEKVSSVADGASAAPPRPRKERARTGGGVRSGPSAGDLVEIIPQPGLVEAYKTR